MTVACCEICASSAAELMYHNAFYLVSVDVLLASSLQEIPPNELP